MVFRKISTWGDGVSDGLAIFFLAAVVWLMAFGALKLRKIIREETLSDPKNIEKYGEFYEPHLRDSPTGYQLYYNIYFMCRRLFTVFCIFYM